MPCIFCIAAFAILAGAITTAVLDRLEADLESVAADGVRRVHETASVAKFDLEVPLGRGRAPVAVTVYKRHRRVRIQILTHNLTKDQAEEIENRIAAAAALKVVGREFGDIAEAVAGDAAVPTTDQKVLDLRNEIDG